MKRFVLASASPRRHEILEEIGLKHIQLPSDEDENLPNSLSPVQYVMEIALLKGASVAKKLDKGNIVISADTVVVSDDKILGKPKDEEDAFAMLKALSGKWHSVYTGFAVIDTENGNSCAKHEHTRVKFRDMTDREIKKYIASGECMDKAGSYGIQGKGRLFVEKIDGDYFNVVGLPVCALAKMLKDEFSIDIL